MLDRDVMDKHAINLYAVNLYEHTQECKGARFIHPEDALVGTSPPSQ